MLYPTIRGFLNFLDVSNIPQKRKVALGPLTEYLQHKLSENETIRLNFICTHNSRRSQFAQVWAQAISAYFGFGKVICYSGGTEATAIYKSVLEILRKQGFGIEKLSDGENPIYSIKYDEDEHPLIGFSKIYDHQFNPKSNFAAVMTCSQADGDCPFIAGAEKRFPVPWKDPKEYDGTDQQFEKYRESSLQIATELYFVFSQIKQK